MSRTFGVLVLFGFILGTSLVRLHGQAQSAQKPVAFEVASVKLNRSGEQRSSINTPGTRYVATNVTLNELIAWAYGESGPPHEPRPDYQMSVGPSWKNADRFDVDAV